LEHCGVASDPDGEMKDYGDVSPQIVREFANAISLFHRNGFPIHNFNFREDLDQGVNTPDVLGVTHLDYIPATEIEWNVKSLIKMDQLSVLFECPIVKDMVVDEMRKL
jgi:hypothetical protein